MSPHCYLPTALSHTPIPTISCCSFISGGEFCSIFAQHPSCSFSGWKDPEIPSNLCLTSSCDQHLDGAHLANSKFSLTCFKFSDESEVTPRHRLRWGTIPLTQMGRIPITPSSRYYLHRTPQSFSVKCGFLWSEQLLCNLQAVLDKSTSFQEGDEGERGGGVGSGNPFGDDNEEEEVGPHSVIS